MEVENVLETSLCQHDLKNLVKSGKNILKIMNNQVVPIYFQKTMSVYFYQTIKISTYNVSIHSQVFLTFTRLS